MRSFLERQYRCLLFYKLAFCFEYTFEVGMMAYQHLLQSFTKIVKQRPSVSNLKRLRCSTGSSICKSGATVSTDNLDAWMSLQPGGKGLGGRILQEINRHVLLAHPQGWCRSFVPCAKPTRPPPGLGQKMMGVRLDE